jgi:predicted transcriptional regulator
MTMLELKSILINRIAEISDIKFLEAIKTILDEKVKDSVLELTDYQKDEIRESQNEIKEGLFLYNKDIEREIEGWLNAK